MSKSNRGSVALDRACRGFSRQVNSLAGLDRPKPICLPSLPVQDAAATHQEAPESTIAQECVEISTEAGWQLLGGIWMRRPTDREIDDGLADLTEQVEAARVRREAAAQAQQAAHIQRQNHFFY